MIRIGLYGGSFDPIHFGHLISARNVAEQLSLTRIVLIPCARPPHLKHHQLADVSHRIRMAELATEGDPLFEVDDLEARREGKSYTFDTVSSYRQTFGQNAELFWIIGGDTLPELPTWFRIRELVQQVQIVTAVRPGWSPPPPGLLAPAVGDESAAQLLSNCLRTPNVEISATDIRSRVAGGLPVRYLTPDPVRSYIDKQGLYQADA